MSGKVKICPSCGNSFECRGNDDCWCESYQIHRKDYFRLTLRYNDCLCQECLKDYTEDSSAQ